MESPLSDTDTLAYTRTQRLQLQESYSENYRVYLPYLLRRMRLGAREVPPDSASDTTITPAPAGVMGREVDEYFCKRTMVVAQALLGKTMVFGSREEFERFRNQHDNRPALRVLVPYMSMFRRRVPFMVFERPADTDGAELAGATGAPGATNAAAFAGAARAASRPTRTAEPTSRTATRNGAREDRGSAKLPGECPETPFCNVFMRSGQYYRRFLLRFANGDVVAVFQHNFLPFADFCFRGTRFRIIGTSMAPYLMAPYSPQLRLLVVDDAQPALCDRLVPRAQEHAAWNSRMEPSDDPVPHESNPLVIEAASILPSIIIPLRFIPHERPPFGLCMDATVYRGRRPIFRKYADAAQVMVYEARGGETDLLVLTAVMMSLRENGLRTAVRYPNTVGGGPGLLFSL